MPSWTEITPNDTARVARATRRADRGRSSRLAGMELIHTCYRITDPERSVAFYEALGFEKRR